MIEIIAAVMEFFNFTRAQKFVLTLVFMLSCFGATVALILKYGYFRIGKVQAGDGGGGKPVFDAIKIEALLQRTESNLKEWLRDHDKRNHEQAGDMADAIKRLRTMAEENHAATQRRLAEMQKAIDGIIPKNKT